MFIAICRVIMSVSNVTNNTPAESPDNKMDPAKKQEFQSKLNGYQTTWNGISGKYLLDETFKKDIEAKLAALRELIDTEGEEAKINELINVLAVLIPQSKLKIAWAKISDADKNLLKGDDETKKTIYNEIEDKFAELQKLINDNGEKTKINELINALNVLINGSSKNMSAAERIKCLQDLDSEKGNLFDDDYLKIKEKLKNKNYIIENEFNTLLLSCKSDKCVKDYGDELVYAKNRKLGHSMHMSMKVIQAQNRYKEFEIENLAYNKMQEKAEKDTEMKKYLNEGIGSMDNDIIERRSRIIQEERNQELRRTQQE